MSKLPSPEKSPTVTEPLEAWASILPLALSTVMLPLLISMPLLP
jgi:hypothetical protein